DYARDALKEFGDQFLNHGHSKNKLGLVTYSSSYGDNTLYDAYDEVTYHTGASMTSDSTVFDTVVDKLDPPNGETNVQMGIKIAGNILAADTSLNPKFIVLFSDGSANRSASPITAEPLGASQIIPYTYGGKTYDMSFKFTQFNYSKLGSFSYSDSSYTTNHTNAHLVATVSEALLAQDSGINMYSIFYRNPGLDDLEYGQGVFVMKNANASGHYIEISPGDVANFADIFSEIEKEIEESISPWLIEDPMADYIEFAGFNDTRLAGANFDPGTRTLKWNLQSTEAEADGDGNYHYHLSYNIVLNTNDEGFQNNFAYPTNNTTTLTYQKTTDPDTYSEHQVTFIVPTVKGVSENTKLLHVKALDMIAYQDGNSASGDPFPRPYFAFFWDDNGTPGAQLSQEELDTLVFTLDAAPFVPNEHPYFIYDYPFRVQYVNQETNVVHNDPDALDESPGIYTFRFSTQDNDTKHTYTVAALDREGTSYDFRFFQNGQLEVREQSKSPTLYTPYETGVP
ncbi:MAG: VWA domain-containing protein, partial [Eubacterium sp.]